ncbi:MAG: protein-L-isoaspartate O-methyltransferase [Gammaproteobacteria bacterium]
MIQGSDARINMVKQQLRTWQVTDERILQIMETLPRDQFVPEAYQNLAYADYAIPLNETELMLSPKVVAKALQVLNIQSADHILEVGTGTGYITAILSQLGREVFSMEINPNFLKKAEINLPHSHYKNVTLSEGDAHEGWLAEGDYDCIFVTGSYPIALPDALKTQVRLGGRIFAFVGKRPAVQAQLYTRIAPQVWSMRSLFETDVPALVHAEHPKLFTF